MSLNRKPYTGSCHCGETKYVVWATFPPPTKAVTQRPKAPAPGTSRVYKCNCTICHKAGIFHVRLPDAPEDFALLSPHDPFTESGDYLTADGIIHFFFCKKCGVRCILFCGDGEEIIRTDIPGREGQEVKVWRPKKAGWREYLGADDNGRRSYLSVNAFTLDARQEGLDLREWVEQKRIQYLDCLDEVEEASHERPHIGGTY